jgi:hypothetical protein
MEWDWHSGRRLLEYEALRMGMGPRVAAAAYPYRLEPRISGKSCLSQEGYPQVAPRPH